MSANLLESKRRAGFSSLIYSPKGEVTLLRWIDPSIPYLQIGNLIVGYRRLSRHTPDLGQSPMERLLIIRNSQYLIRFQLALAQPDDQGAQRNVFQSRLRNSITHCLLIDSRLSHVSTQKERQCIEAPRFVSTGFNPLTFNHVLNGTMLQSLFLSSLTFVDVDASQSHSVVGFQISPELRIDSQRFLQP